MVRQLLVPVVLAVVLAPDWASAFNPCPPPVYLPLCQPGYVIVPGPVVYGRPVGDCVPTAGTVAPQQKVPTIVPERMEPPKRPEVKAEPSKTIPAKAEELATPKAAEASPLKAPEPLPVKPVPLPVQPAEATIKPAAPVPAKPVEPAPAKPVEPQPEAKKVVPPIGNDRIPTPAVPPGPPAKSDLGELKFDIPPLGDLPPVKPDPIKPIQPEPIKPEVPKSEPKSAEKPKTQETLPPFNIDLPKADAGMAQPVEANKPTTSNSSPLANRLSVVDVFPREGANAVSAKRGVTFVNKSARDVSLTIDGQTATLPSKTVLMVDLPAAFKWQIAGEPERSEKVPDGVPGIDVVIRK